MNILPRDKQIAVIAALSEGTSIRATERLTGIHRDTIMRLGARVGRGCAILMDQMMRDLPSQIIQLDELWSFIGKKQKRLKPTDAADLGDCYTFIALDSINKAIIAHTVGKRDNDTTDEFIADLRGRVLGSPQISSDGFEPYVGAVAMAFGEDVHYGQIVKSYNGEPPVNAARRYSPGWVVGVQKRRVVGFPPEFLISTSHIERQNLTVRMQSRRFTRLTNGFSKKFDNHTAAVALYVAHYNLCRAHMALSTKGAPRMTPAMSLGVTDRVWSIAELIDAALSVSGNNEPDAPTLVSPPAPERPRFSVIQGGRPD
jgi:IS1 family transposase